MSIANNHGFAMLRENPESMGTSLDMLRRAANTLLNLAKHPDNRSLFVQHEPRLLNLVMSQILEQKVAAIVAQVLFQCSSTDTQYCGGSSNSLNDSFYTPSMSRSRNVTPSHHHHPHTSHSHPPHPPHHTYHPPTQHQPHHTINPMSGPSAVQTSSGHHHHHANPVSSIAASS
jgi:hypothetical protein